MRNYFHKCQTQHAVYNIFFQKNKGCLKKKNAVPSTQTCPTKNELGIRPFAGLFFFFTFFFLYFFVDTSNKKQQIIHRKPIKINLLLLKNLKRFET